MLLAVALMCLPGYHGQSLPDARNSKATAGEVPRRTEEGDVLPSSKAPCNTSKQPGPGAARQSLSSPPHDSTSSATFQHHGDGMGIEAAGEALAFRVWSAPPPSDEPSPSSSSSRTRSPARPRCPFEDDPDSAQAAAYWRDTLTSGIRALEMTDARPRTRDVFDALDAFGTMISCCPGALVARGGSAASSPDKPPPPRSCGLLMFGDGRGRTGEGNSVLGVGIMLNFARALRLARLPELAFSMLDTDMLMDIEFKPHRALWEREMALALLQLGEVSGAIAVLQHALEVEPRDLRTLQLLGASLVIEGSVTEGETAQTRVRPRKGRKGGREGASPLMVPVMACLRRRTLCRESTERDSRAPPGGAALVRRTSFPREAPPAPRPQARASAADPRHETGAHDVGDATGPSAAGLDRALGAPVRYRRELWERGSRRGSLPAWGPAAPEILHRFRGQRGGGGRSLPVGRFAWVSRKGRRSRVGGWSPG